MLCRPPSGVGIREAARSSAGRTTFVRLDCTTEKYAQLYARWLIEPGKLLDIAQLQPGERVIDLCGGTGIVATEAVARGARTAFVVDLNPRLHRGVNSDDARCVPPFQGRAEDVDKLLAQHIEMLHGLALHGPGCRCARYTPDFDLVVCRQAIGYLDIKKTALAVSNVLRDGGRFVFNTFVRPRWSLKSYKLGDRRFFEASAFLGQDVFHIQASLGLGVDVTHFQWHTELELDGALAPYFDLQKRRVGKTLYYVCTK